VLNKHYDLSYSFLAFLKVFHPKHFLVSRISLICLSFLLFPSTGLPSINPDFSVFKVLTGFLQMSTGGAFLRRELQDISYLESHPEICQMFKDAGCYRFCEKLQGYHQGIAEAFAKILMEPKCNWVLWKCR
jgi:hypothetical protein